MFLNNRHGDGYGLTRAAGATTFYPPRRTYLGRMHIRDAVEADADAMAQIADAPVDVMRNLIHDRTVRVAEPDHPTPTDPHQDTDNGAAELLGFVSFDAQADVVHITQLDGTDDACEELLSEPIRFAKQEAMDVELLVPLPEESLAGVAERVGFDRRGRGPQFNGTPTIRYRLKP